MNTSNTNIIQIKNISHLKRALKKFKQLIPLTQYPSNYFTDAPQNLHFVSLNKIKEFFSIINSSISFIVGLNTDMQRMLDLHTYYPLPKIFVDLITMCIAPESLQSIRLLDILSNNKKYILLRLALSMMKTRILIVKHNKQYWMDVEEYIYQEINSYQSIPLSLRLNLDISTKHVILMRDMLDFSPPSFVTLGLLNLSGTTNKIIDLQVFVYKQETYHKVSSELSQFRQQFYPLNLKKLHTIFMKQKISLPFLDEKEHKYFLENIIQLLHPNIV